MKLTHMIGALVCATFAALTLSTAAFAQNERGGENGDAVVEDIIVVTGTRWRMQGIIQIGGTNFSGFSGHNSAGERALTDRICNGTQNGAFSSCLLDVDPNATPRATDAGCSMLGNITSFQGDAGGVWACPSTSGGQCLEIYVRGALLGPGYGDPILYKIDEWGGGC
jgi:hypothetical protein